MDANTTSRGPALLLLPGAMLLSLVLLETIASGDDPHLRNPVYPYTNHCTDCHAADLRGGLGPSCTACHDDGWWDHSDAKNLAPPLNHTEIKGVDAQHKPGYGRPFDSRCTVCHGSKLFNGFASSCYTCHGRLWAGEGAPADHTELKGAQKAKHKPGFGDPFGNGCTQCHGPNLDDGFATSCFSCHGQLWGGDGPPPDHTIVKGDDALHKPGFGRPYDNDCTQCHGPNLDDGFATSCYTCHDRIWAGEGPPADHTLLLLGIASHKPGLEDPITNGCTQCHGPNLNDGFATSCLDCHGAVWEGTDGHHMPGRTDPWNNCTFCHGDDLLGGISGVACIDCHNDFSPPDPPPSGHHFPGRDAPLSNCTLCHGEDLSGLSSPLTPSCFLCHDQLWGDENRPPVVDAGGPYQALTDVVITFDASGTTDPDGDTLTYVWDFGDGTAPTSESEDPTASHSYSAAGTYSGSLSVDDGVNDPVVVNFSVEITDDGPPPPGADRWTITTTETPADIFDVTFESHQGTLVGVKDDGVHQPSLALGIEMVGVIYWIDIWIDLSGTRMWGIGDQFFGNINREAGTMEGVVLEQSGGISTFSGIASD